jgi:hypothetical protein
MRRANAHGRNKGDFSVTVPSQRDATLHVFIAAMLRVLINPKAIPTLSSWNKTFKTVLK